MQIDDTSPFDGQPRVLLVGAVIGRQPSRVVDEHLDELAGLAEAAGAHVAGRAVQRRDAPDPRTFIGRGKVDALREEAETTDAAVLVFDDDLSPSQVKNLEEATKRTVVDRSGLILEIFHQRARSREARTQVELARSRYLLPRLTRQWTHLSRQAGGIGQRGGEGEKQLEADRRILRTRIQRLERELVSIERTRDLQRRRRREAIEIGLAGYTNAGKSTLFNRLTGDDTYVRDQLFATLDARLRRGWLPAADGHGPGPAIFVDTVGFIRKLPHHLVASFRSTLGELAFADLVLHVVDRSHPRWREQREVGDAVLQELGVDPRRVVVVHNKLDLLTDGRPSEDGAVAVSAVTGEGLDDLRRILADRAADLADVPAMPAVAAPAPAISE